LLDCQIASLCLPKIMFKIKENAQNKPTLRESSTPFYSTSNGYNNQYCFKGALISALTVVKNLQRCSAYNINISLEIFRLSDEIK